MANRVLVGDHPTHGYGLYVSPPGVDVKAADNDYFLLDSAGAGHGQLLLWKEVTTTSEQNTNPISFSYNSFGVRNYAIAFCSQIPTGFGNANTTGEDISCISEAVDTARPKANYSLFGGALGAVTDNADYGNDISFEINLTNNGNTGTCTITRSSPSSSAKEFNVQVLIFKEEA